MARMRRREGAREFSLFAYGELCVLSTVSFEMGESRVAEGRYQRIHDGQGRLIGFQPLRMAPPKFINGPALDAVPNSMASISANEIKANAFSHFPDGRSRTSGMKDCDRDKNVNRRTLIAETSDFIEETIEKVREFGSSRLVCA